MKAFDPFMFSYETAAAEVAAFKPLLTSKAELSEKHDVLPFFRQRRHLSSLVGSLLTNVSRLDRIAYEYDLFGDFTCDLVVGDSRRHAWTLIEFEDARANSIFQTGAKYTDEWGRRFEHGVSQVIDWFWKLEDQSRTEEFRHRFGGADARFSAVLVIGRNKFLPPRERKRLTWRLDRVVINSNKVHCLTFDDLLEEIHERLADSALVAKAKPT